MRLTWILGLSFAAAIAAGCGSGDQNGSSNGGKAGSAGSTGGSTGGTGGATGGSNTGGTGTGGATGGTSTGGTGTGGATGGTGTGGTGGCTMLATDGSKIGAMCSDAISCPSGYTCHAFAGITVTYTCEILCDQDCQCPAGTQCVPRSDKANNWMECGKP